MQKRTIIILVVVLSVSIIAAGLTLGLVFGLRKDEGESKISYVNPKTGSLVRTVNKTKTDYKYVAYLVTFNDSRNISHEVINLEYNDTKYFKENGSDWELFRAEKTNDTTNSSDTEMEEITDDKGYEALIKDVETFIDKLKNGTAKLKRVLVVNNLKLTPARYGCTYIDYDDVVWGYFCYLSCGWCSCRLVCYPVIFWSRHIHDCSCNNCPVGYCANSNCVCTRPDSSPWVNVCRWSYIIAGTLYPNTCKPCNFKLSRLLEASP